MPPLDNTISFDYARARPHTHGIDSVGPSAVAPAVGLRPLALCRVCGDSGLVLSFDWPRRCIPCEACRGPA